jgi:predicted transcriptional regulator
MNRQGLPRPTDAELGVLRVLWELGPSSVRQVVRAMNEVRETGYTTVLKLLQIMYDKGLVERDENERPQIYRPRLTREQTQRQLLADLMERAFEGSAKQLVLQALATRRATRAELAEVERLLDEIEKG